VINLEYADCYKCEFSYDLWNRFTCYIIPDSSSIKENYPHGRTDDSIGRICFNGTLNGVSHLTQSELTPLCQRFESVQRIKVHDVKSVDENLFQQCRRLVMVWKTDKQFKEIKEDLYLEYPKLTDIDMSKNKLTTLPENVFLGEKELQFLRLDNNQISCLPPNIFRTLTKLRHLSLTGNKIQSLNPKWFKSLQSLKTLDLSDNKINDLPKNVFAKLENLNSLKLNGNQLTSIHSHSFGIHRNLSKINLDNNKINAIDEKFIDNLALDMLDMSGNICSNKNLTGRDEMKQHLSTCFKNFQPRQKSSKQNHKKIFKVNNS